MGTGRRAVLGAWHPFSQPASGTIWWNSVSVGGRRFSISTPRHSDFSSPAAFSLSRIRTITGFQNARLSGVP